ncbi:MAG: DUF4340 domain-containing protein [Anaerolineales bacterium]|nr:DUF4340 domain-containing protein [Anaerolineales bacterium]
MIRRSTVVYIILLLALVGAYYYLNNRAQPADVELSVTAEPTVEVTYLFPADKGTPSGIRVESKSGDAVEVVRDAENAWMLTQPIEVAADSASAEAAASQVTTIRVLDSEPGVDPEIVGLEVPEHVLTIKFTSGAERTVDVGVITPSESGYYVRDASGRVVIVSRSAIDFLLGLLENPPYLETLTPSPVPATETSTPLPTSTPEGATPTSENVTPQP